MSTPPYEDEVARARAAADQYMSVLRDVIVPPIVTAERLVRQAGGSEHLATAFALMFAEMVVMPVTRINVNDRGEHPDDPDPTD